jgi:hypothetical protein
VKRSQPFSIDECFHCQATNLACGDVYLHQRFELLVRSRLGDQAETLLTQRRLSVIESHFRYQICQQFNPFDDHDSEEEYYIPMAGAPVIPGILEREYLRLTK